jgi:hypothetical protein
MLTIKSVFFKMAVTEYQEVIEQHPLYPNITPPPFQARLTLPSASTHSSAKFQKEESPPTPVSQKLCLPPLEPLAEH